MPEYKLVYFNGRGRAELARWMFLYAGLPFTDQRVDMPDWPAMKPTVPFGRLPMLLVDGRPILQSMAIARYVARQTGLVPQDSLDAAFCDEVVDTCHEILGEVYIDVFNMTFEDIKKMFKEDIMPKLMTPFLTRLETHLQGKQWLVADKMSWADMCLGFVPGLMTKFDEDLLKKYPAVKSVVERVLALPQIKQWNDKQPEYLF